MVAVVGVSRFLQTSNTRNNKTD